MKALSNFSAILLLLWMVIGIGMEVYLCYHYFFGESQFIFELIQHWPYLAAFKVVFILPMLLGAMLSVLAAMCIVLSLVIIAGYLISLLIPEKEE